MLTECKPLESCKLTPFMGSPAQKILICKGIREEGEQRVEMIGNYSEHMGPFSNKSLAGLKTTEVVTSQRRIIYIDAT